MPRIDFYVLHPPASQDLAQFACRLLDKIWQQGYRVYIHTNNQAQAQALSQLLWTFRDTSFVPHDLYPDAASSKAPVRIGYHPTQACSGMEILINLATSVPEFYQRFERVVEIVNQDPAVRAAGRQRYRVYREAGDLPEAPHDIHN